MRMAPDDSYRKLKRRDRQVFAELILVYLAMAAGAILLVLVLYSYCCVS
jgi:hypothetical protein